jgi:hypothetical protein
MLVASRRSPDILSSSRGRTAQSKQRGKRLKTS